MKNKRKSVKLDGLIVLAIVGILLIFALSVIRVSASSLYIPTDVSRLKSNMNLPMVTWTSDRFGWTVDQALPSGEGRELRNADGGWASHSYWYEQGLKVSTGVPYNNAVAGVGQHVYYYKRGEGVVPIAEWEVTHFSGWCVHTNGGFFDWHGIPSKRICGQAYYSGWNGYCADCGYKFYGLIYMSMDNIKQFQAIDTRYNYFYQDPDPACRKLEQQYAPEDHYCNSVSWNMYKVKYDANGVPNTVGAVNPTYHMYNNQTVYEGETVTGCTDRLSDNLYGFEKEGYVVTGWSTTPGDPYGTPEFALGEKLTSNLSNDDYKVGEEDGSGKGTVTLYARWKKVEGSLIVSPGNSSDRTNGAIYKDTSAGTYNSSTKATTIKGVYTNSYVIDMSKLTAPKLGTVSFNTQGGAYIEPITVYKEFLSWEKSYPFNGRFSDELNKYVFFSKADGKVDTLTAIWKNNTITLPEATKNGYSFGGWYEDPACTKPVGGGGEKYTPNGDITLYAKWSQLVLQSVTDLTVDGGKGGVDLTWSQEDARQKFYKIYQKREGASSWTQIFSANDVAQMGLWSGGKKEESVPGTYNLTIPASGFYTIEIYGAQGSDYGSYSGGKGGYVKTKVWLNKNEVVTYVVGSRAGGGAGNIGGSGAAGGGYSTVTTHSYGVVATAGGGGGASAFNNGGAGGLTSGLITGSGGGSGVAGGGSGWNGGKGATRVVHNHVASCEVKHSHVAGCYTYVPHTHVEGVCPQDEYPTYCGGVWWDDMVEDWVRGWCPNCGVDETYGCTNADGDGKCAGGGTYWTCTKTSENVLVCGKTEGQLVGYSCAYRNYPSGHVINSNPSYGGSNYINTSASVSYTESYGQRSGAGLFRITMDEVGYLDTLRLDNVSANDLARPEPIDQNSVSIEAAEGSMVKVSYNKPEDNGTVYYHYAESYLTTDRERVLSTTIASPTYNNIVTGVKRYYYKLDTSPSTYVSESNKQGITTTQSIRVTVNVNYIQYLHIAAVDGAGNVSQPIHVRIEPREVPWNLKTEQIGVSETVGGVNYGSVYAAGSNRYYVRADGSTPFDLAFRAYVQGTADTEYQIDNEMFEINLSGVGTQKYNTKLPLSSASVAGTVVLTPSDFIRSGGGESLLQDARYTTANRTSYAAVTNFTQAFIGYPEYSGKTLVVTPHAGASYVNNDGQDDVKWSDSTDDTANQVQLILDGVGPVISGAGVITGVTELDLSSSPINLDITATDALSGLNNIKITVTNPDSGERKVYNQEADGHIRITLSQDESIFQGSFAMEITAKDNVGNETVITYNPISIVLQANISKTQEDGYATYAKGEGAYLNIATYGYIDRVEIDWPAKILEANPDLPTFIDYASDRMYEHQEQIPFVVPFTANEGERIEIPVRAYKNGVVKQTKPYLIVSGNIMDDIRYRIK